MHNLVIFSVNIQRMDTCPQVVLKCVYKRTTLPIEKKLWQMIANSVANHLHGHVFHNVILFIDTSTNA